MLELTWLTTTAEQISLNTDHQVNMLELTWLTTTAEQISLNTEHQGNMF